jgi:hypothetical protein
VANQSAASEAAHTNLADGFLDCLVSKVFTGNLAASHFIQGICRPLSEPVNCGAVDQAREQAAALPEGIPNSAQAQHDMQVGPAAAAATTAAQISAVAGACLQS